MTSTLALDLGTTAIKAGRLSCSGAFESPISIPAPQIAAEGACRESDALAYAEAAERVLESCNAGGKALPLGLSCQRSSFLIWERSSGHPLTPMISWQDTRGAASCEALREQGDFIRATAGLPLTPYYFAPKLRQLLQDRPNWRDGLANGALRAGTLDAFLISRWSGGRECLTDASMAARTLLMDIRTRQWSPALCEVFGIPVQGLPRIVPSAAIGLPLEHGLTLQASLADQSAAILAMLDADGDDALVNLGTGGFVVRRLPQGAPSLHGYLETLVYQDAAGHTHFALEGTLNAITAALAPYPVHACRAGDLAADSDIYCLAEPGGIGAPYFRTDLGLTFSQPVEHLPPPRIAALLLEGVIFRVARILEDFHRVAPLRRIHLSGGLSHLDALCAGIARCAPCSVHCAVQEEASLFGAALLATGMTSSGKTGAKVSEAEVSDALTEKYRRWETWLDELIVLKTG